MRAAYAHAREQAEQRTRAEDALRHAQKLEALGSLTGGVAHDFNNLLAVVSNSVYLLKHLQTRRGASPEESAPIAAITRAVEAGTKLTRQLLAFSRRQPLAPEVVQVADVLVAMTDLLQTIVSRRIELETSVPAHLPLVKVDPAELEHAVINLVVNARDAVRNRGRIVISGDVWRNPATEQAFVRVSVRDNGSGIPPELIERVFDPFFPTKPRGAGTGLGLSQVYGFCTQAVGTVRIDSTPGAGTTVTMYLPATRDDRPGEPQTEAAPVRIPGHILLVEDNVDIGSTMREVLRSLGASVTCVRSGDEALRGIGQRGAGRFDVVVSDVVMPGRVSGIQLAKRLRRRRPDLPVILMTAYTAELQAAISDGLTVLSKPVAPHTLARVLARKQAEAK